MAKRLRFSADISCMFTHLDMLDRIAAAAEAGFDGVDLPFPYEHPAPELRDKAVFAGLRFNRLDGPPPNYTGGDQGFAGDPSLTDRFQRDFRRVLRHADVLGAGMIRLHVARSPQLDMPTLLDSLRWASAEANGRVVLVAPSIEDEDGLDWDQAISTITEVATDNLKLMFDTGAIPQNETSLDLFWTRCADHVGHVVIRETAATTMMPLLARSGYAGWICAALPKLSPTKEDLLKLSK